MSLKQRYLKYLDGMVKDNQFPWTYTKWLEKWEEEREVQ